MNNLIKSILIMLFVLLGVNQSFADQKVTFYHYDLLGSPVATTDENGDVTWRESYEPWGKKTLNEDESNDNVRGYTGHVNDKETGLTYMQARYYDPEIGRFMGVDPVGFQEENPIMFNRYAYANNNPYKFTDPNGEAPSNKINMAQNIDMGVIKGLAGGRGNYYSSIMGSSTRVNNSISGNFKMKPIPKAINTSANSNNISSVQTKAIISTNNQTINGGIYRANKYSSNWANVNISDALAKFSGKNPKISFTSSGKKLTTNSKTGIQIVHDIKGNYFRIKDTNIKSKRSYLDMDGKIPNNKTTESGSQTGRTQSEYNAATHFNTVD